MDLYGWKKADYFYVFNKPKKGTNHITICEHQTNSSHTAYFSKTNKCEGWNGVSWRKLLDFYAYPDDMEIVGIHYDTTKLKTTETVRGISIKNSVIVNKSDKPLKKEVKGYFGY